MHIEFHDEPTALFQESVARAVQPMHVGLEPVPERNARDLNAVVQQIVEQTRDLIELLVVERSDVLRNHCGEQPGTVRGTGHRQVLVPERDATRRHVLARVAHDQLGEDHP